MALESADYIHELVEGNPDPQSFVANGEKHLTLIKHVLQTQFPEIIAAAVNNAVGDEPDTNDDELLWDPAAIKAFILANWGSWGLTPGTETQITRVAKSTTQSHSTAAVKVTFDAGALEDDGPYWDVTNSRILPTNGVKSRWRVSAGLGEDTPGGASGVTAVEIRKQGNVVRGGTENNNGGDFVGPQCSVIVELNGVDEYVEVYSRSEWSGVIGEAPFSGDPWDYNYFEVEYLGDSPPDP